VSTVCADGEAIPLADSSIDTVISSEMLYYLDRPRHCLDEMYRVLRPGGRLLLCYDSAVAAALGRVRTLFRKLGLRRMWFDDGSPPIMALIDLLKLLGEHRFQVTRLEHIVLLPFAMLDRLNRWLENGFLRWAALFVFIIARKT